MTFLQEEQAALSGIPAGLSFFLEQTPPELAADILDKGIVFTITITNDPMLTVVLGSGKVLDRLDILSEVMI